MELLELKANSRQTTGDGPARALRRQGQVPAILYGPETEGMLLSVNGRDLETVLKNARGSQAILNLVVQDSEAIARSAMIKEIQRDPLTRDFLHIDFYQVAMDRKIKLRVPIVVKGKAKGVEAGGMLQLVRRELEVMCLPHEYPEAIEIDITDLDMGDSIHVSDIPLEGDIEIAAEGNITVATILAPKIEAEEEVEEGEEAEGAAEEVSEAGGEE